MEKQRMRSRTWLIAVFHDKNCLYADNISGSADYIPRLLEICYLITTVTKNPQEYTVELARSDIPRESDTKDPGIWHNTLVAKDIEIFEEAYRASRMLSTP